MTRPALHPYTPADLTPPSPATLLDAARVALAYRRLHAGEAARWAEVLFGVGEVLDGAAMGRGEAVPA